MKLSIVICTYNRAIQLEQLLEDLSYQHARLNTDDKAEVEVILVDNNSFDNTKEVAYKFTESTVLTVKYYLENRQGVAASRNHGIKQASGELLAFLDDDLTLDEDWLKEALRIAAGCKDREIGVYGGRSIPLWQERVPKWLNSTPPYGIDQALFTGHNYGDEESFYPVESDIGVARFPLGTNIMYRKEIFDNCGDFRTDLGRNAAGGVGLHEDTEFLEYLSMLKVPMLYVPQLIVFHPITSEQMTAQNMRRWYFKSGCSQYWMTHTDRMRRVPDKLAGLSHRYRKFMPGVMADIKIAGIPLYLFIKIFLIASYWLITYPSMNKKRSFYLTLQLSKSLGEIEAAGLVYQQITNRKFSFKDRLKDKVSNS